MATVQEHYRQVLAPVYSWMLGGFDAAIQRNSAFFDRHAIAPSGCRVAVDLGAGCGFQSIPLARMGFRVTAIDLADDLLSQLRQQAESQEIKTINADLLDFEQHIESKAELVVCMTDTICHLPTREDVIGLIGTVYRALEAGGRFIMTFRDLTTEMTGLERFIPVRSDGEQILTCFLEYEPQTVKVHDLLYEKTDEGWRLAKSFYRKLRLGKTGMEEQLTSAGFDLVHSRLERGMVTIVAGK